MIKLTQSIRSELHLVLDVEFVMSFVTTFAALLDSAVCEVVLNATIDAGMIGQEGDVVDYPLAFQLSTEAKMALESDRVVISLNQEHYQRMIDLAHSGIEGHQVLSEVSKLQVLFIEQQKSLFFVI